MCPDCHEPLIIVELEGIEIDRCPQCRGTWLDEGELEQIIALAGVEPGRVSAALAAARSGRRSRRRCPRCRARLRVVIVGDDARVELDACPRGHGLWLDAGELRALVRTFSDGEEGAVAGFFADLFRQELADEPPGGK